MIHQNNDFMYTVPVVTHHDLSPIYITALYLLKDVSILVRVILTWFPGTAVIRFNYNIITNKTCMEIIFHIYILYAFKKHVIESLKY